LTVPEVAQSVILTRLEGGKTPMPDGEHIRDFARHGTTMAIFLSAARSGQLVDELRAGGYSDDTPVVVAYKVTWPDELVLHTTIGELAETVKQHKLWRHTLFLVGKALSATGTRSHLYNAGHFHTYRKADPAARRALRAVERGPVDDTPAPADDSPSGDTAVSATTGRPKAGWPLHTSRSGWVAARVGTSSWTKTGAATRSDATGQPASAAAWSAVHGWQETARSASRSGVRPARSADAAKPVRPAAVDQESFEFEPEVEPAHEVPAVEPAVRQPDQSEAPRAENPKAKAGRQGGRKSGPKRNNNSRKVAGRSTQPGGHGRPADQP
jgi:hypothetical protein